MGGETNLDVLLRNLDPALHSSEWVFCVAFSREMDKLFQQAFCTCREDEGVTLILPREVADQEKLKYDLIFRRITLQVHSSLEAVGLLAEVTNRLAAASISVNVISASYHDHLFIPTTRAEEALDILTGTSRSFCSGADANSE